MIYRFNLSNSTTRKMVTVDGSKTLRQIFADNYVEIGNGNINFDGTTYTAAEIDDPIDNLGIDPDTVHFLSSVVKRDNAVTAVQAGSALVIASGIKADELKTMVDFAPEFTELKDEDGEVQFMVRIGDGDGMISKFGAMYGTRTNADGYPTITVTAPESVEDVKAWAKGYGRMIVKLNEAEAKMKEHLAEVLAKKEEAENAITFA